MKNFMNKTFFEIHNNQPTHKNRNMSTIDAIDISLIETEKSAYALGWLFEGSTYSKERFTISTPRISHDTDRAFKNFAEKMKLFVKSGPTDLSLSFYPVQIGKDFVDAVSSTRNPSNPFNISEFKNDALRWHFLRGLFDIHGGVEWSEDDGLFCYFSFLIQQQSSTANFINIPTMGGDFMEYSGTNAEDLLHQLYKDANWYAGDNFQSYMTLLRSQIRRYRQVPTFTYELTHKDAMPPTKNHASDAGYDLRLVEKIKEENGVHYYTTGVRVKPPHGCYFELFGRSSIGKSGHMLQNCVGVIDASYRGEIIVGLVKTRQNTPDLELPIKLVQLVLRESIHALPVEGKVNQTSRGDKGFGSSGKQ
jgi:dUTP pyrophosphatase